MPDKLRICLLMIVVIFAATAESLAQKRDELKPPPATASLAETQAWLVGAVGKYGSYKTRIEVVALSSVKFVGCEFSFNQTRKSGSTSTATMGPTRTTYIRKDETKVDAAKIMTDGISVADHIYPELRTIKLWHSGFDLMEGSTAGRVYEIVVKREAAEAIKTALVQVQRLCTAKN